ncbi:MAG: response regulator [Chloroflexi bacterium]|jgi:DNA-binding response OmpR family regulator|nr:response regulator [Chloroflexota bacterium]HLG50127.1 response regulator [Chloroflexota bacterium]
MPNEPEVICASPDDWRRVRLSAALERAGYSVRTCATTRELLHLAARRREPVDEAGVLLLDASLSEEIAPSKIVAALRRTCAAVRTVVLADQNQESEIIECLRVGADDYVHWPAEPSEIIAIVGRVMTLPRVR